MKAWGGGSRDAQTNAPQAGRKGAGTVLVPETRATFRPKVHPDPRLRVERRDAVRRDSLGDRPIPAHIVRESLRQALEREGKVLDWHAHPRGIFLHHTGDRRSMGERALKRLQAQHDAAAHKRRENEAYYQNGTEWHMPRGRG